MKRLAYYAHRLRDPDPAVQAANLARAQQRFDFLAPRLLREEGIVLWAPWIGPALAGIPEHDAWSIIEECVLSCAIIVLDLDGAPATDGMLREQAMAEAVGAEVRRVR